MSNECSQFQIDPVAKAGLQFTAAGTSNQREMQPHI